MRKIVTLTLMTLLLLSLCIPAFAEQTEPAAKPLYLGDPGYGWPVGTVPNDGARPIADCAPSGCWQVSISYTEAAGCIIRTYRGLYCTNCREVHASVVVDREIRHVGNCLHTGNGRYICSACGSKWSS